MYLIDGSWQKSSQNVRLPESKVGVISSIVYHLNAKKAAILFLYIIKRTCKNQRENFSFAISFVQI